MGFLSVLKEKLGNEDYELFFKVTGEKVAGIITVDSEQVQFNGSLDDVAQLPDIAEKFYKAIPKGLKSSVNALKTTKEQLEQEQEDLTKQIRELNKDVIEKKETVAKKKTATPKPEKAIEQDTVAFDEAPAIEEKVVTETKEDEVAPAPKIDQVW
jgi:chromosome segregation ATPase